MTGSSTLRHSKNDNYERGTPKEVPPLPLIPDDLDEINIKDPMKSCTFKLYSNPADTTSAKVGFTMPIIDGTQSVRAHIKWYENVKRVCIGLALTSDADVNAHCEARVHTVRSTLRGASLTCFNETIKTWRTQQWTTNAERARNAVVQGTMTDAEFAAARQAAYDNEPKPVAVHAWFKDACQEVIKHATPYKALEKQKRFMRRKMRKPADMKTRMYVNHLHRINYDELNKLPPFVNDQMLADEEILDILVYGLPKSWVRKMDELDFDPFHEGIYKTVDFCERMESSEDFDTNATQVSKKSKTNKKSSKKESGKGQLYCELHGTGGHSTEECKTIKSMVQKHKDGDNSKNGKKSFGNKTWKRSADDAKKNTKKELAAFIKKSIRAELNAISEKKRSADESSSDEEDLNHIDLAAVDFKDMDLSDNEDKSDGEISV